MLGVQLNYSQLSEWTQYEVISLLNSEREEKGTWMQSREYNQRGDETPVGGGDSYYTVSS